MGVIILPPPESTIEPTARTKCIHKKCNGALTVLDLTHETEGFLVYAGACPTCGDQYTLEVTKDEP